MIHSSKFKFVNVRSIGISVLILAGLSLNVFSQYYNLHHFDTGDDLPQPYIYSISQDEQGFLWVGTGDGLARYDGYRFRTFTIEDSLADNFISCSFKSQEALWFGHMSGDLSFYSGNLFGKIKIEDEEKTMITDIEQGPDNLIWASSYSNGFLKIDQKQGITSIKSNNSTSISILKFKFLNAKEVLIGSDNGLSAWRILEDNSLELKEPIPDFPEAKVIEIIRINNSSSYLIATKNDGIFMLEQVAEGYKLAKITKELEPAVQNIQSILLDKDSNLWIGTFGEGLYTMKKNPEGTFDTPIHLSISDESPPLNVKVLFEDREGIIWSGDYGKGLSRLIKRNYSHLHFNNPQLGEDYISLFVDSDSLWIGTEKGLIKMNLKTRTQEGFYELENEDEKLEITAIWKNNNILWLGTSTGGLYHFDPSLRTFTHFPIGSGILENNITSISGNRKQIWVGTKKGVCQILPEEDSIRWYTISNGGLPHNTVNDVLTDSKGKTWITTQSHTLSSIKDGVINNFPIAVENGNFTLNSINEDKDGNIWVGSMGNGIFLIGDSYYTSITSYDGLFSDYCYALESDRNGNLWVAHSGGMSKVTAMNLHVKSIQKGFDIHNTYEFNKNAIVLDKKETLWVGYNSGLLSINTNSGRSSGPPLLNITAIKIDDQEVDITKKIKLPPGRYKLSLDFICVSLKNSENTKYRYFMEGYDDFPNISNIPKVTYPGLTSGKYTFHLSATNDAGIDAESPVILSLTIKRPLWKQLWFYILLIIVILLLLMLYSARQKEILKAERKELELKVEERTAEIRQQQEELEKQHALINEKNKDITDSIIYAKRIQSALMPPQDLMKELLPKSFLIDRPRDIVSGDFFWIAEKNDKVLFAVADCTGHGVPGAFMSILGSRLLNDIIHGRNITSPEKILNLMRREVISSLRQDKDSSSSISSFDSINMGLCSLDRSSNTLLFAGALTPLVFIRKEELTVIKADKSPLGISYHDETQFTLHNLELRKGDMIYLYSDGFQDQFGGEKNKKYSSRRFQNLLIKNSKLPVLHQKAEIEISFNRWKKQNNQTDDMMLMGVKI